MGLTQQQLADPETAIANLNRLRAAGLYRDALAYHDLTGVRILLAEDNTVNQLLAHLRHERGPVGRVHRVAAEDGQGRGFRAASRGLRKAR